MSGYRRFIAYVYEYQKGKKGSNCGFIKVEVRNQRCRIELHLHCIGIPPKAECKIYGIVRKDGLMNGILLGNCETAANTVEYMIETDSINMADSGISFAQIGGIVLITQSGGFFGTEWDDQPVRPDSFREINLPSSPQKEPVIYAEETPEEIPEQPPEEPLNETPVEESPDSEPLLKEPVSVESIPEEPTQNEPTQEDPVPVEPAQHESVQEEPMPDEPTDDTMEATASSAPARQYASPGEEFMPFDDVEFIKCWKIHPNDLARYAPRIRSLRNNRFLQYGYYNFGHLLLGQRSNGKYILGIPGGYDQQERFMANMFGFPYFKECRLIELPKNRGGYWYRLIDAPDFH